MSHQAHLCFAAGLTQSGCASRALGQSLTLEALAVHDGWSTLIILLLGDPHLLEGGERSQDGAADPDRVLALRRGNDLDLHG